MRLYWAFRLSLLIPKHAQLISKSQYGYVCGIEDMLAPKRKRIRTRTWQHRSNTYETHHSLDGNINSYLRNGEFTNLNVPEIEGVVREFFKNGG